MTSPVSPSPVSPSPVSPGPVSPSPVSPRPVSLSIAGSTGSIGRQALEVVDGAEGRFEVVGLGAGSSVGALAEQVRRLRPALVAVASDAARAELASQVPASTEILVGEAGLVALAESAQVVLNAVVGFAGLPVTMAALSAGRRLALANKESLIAAGPVVAAVRATPGAEIVPVDSEHGALHQCLRAGRDRSEVARLVLTGSGGPFRTTSAADLEHVALADALTHPTWQMGPKITVDSSTLMNKGLEVIEAHELFGVDYDRIEVVVHPESVVHSMVEFTDGATLAQLSVPDMRLPIGYALGHPRRLARPYGAIDWSALAVLHFEAPDRERFRCLALAEAAGRAGGVAPAWLNAANEVAVAAFLAGALSWRAIAEVVDETLGACDNRPPRQVADVIEADRLARRCAERATASRARAA